MRLDGGEREGRRLILVRMADWDLIVRSFAQETGPQVEVDQRIGDQGGSEAWLDKEDEDKWKEWNLDGTMSEAVDAAVSRLQL